ncbi:colicin V production protein [Sulfurimonas gotlandica GD1]|uniref:Colicin V production protein n=1 Tax=Sulfurimonas gotlandica (strain DSM 19862 / JCM 16533 / GD1) TaxID=929558 RepID=B6BP27_SULGG|nr:CvpA family protein [Sulfurimonas gotlandica]EDZ61147.1 CvpA family protein [Sulfurimonas gotlandica GD1]EHP30917.1 colicin V production protein [Sulfurimonas gotlandica GD1]
MEFNYFDLVASVIILMLGLKGILNGFFKEVFGLVGIIGGIFVASRIGDAVGQALSDMIFKFENSAAISFAGFLVTLAIFWFFMIGVGYIFKKLSLLSGLGIFDRILGFVFGASKFFLIAAVIAHAAYNIKAIKSSIDGPMANSFLFPALVSTGAFIMKLDPVEISDDINSTIDKVTNEVTKSVKTSTQEVVEKTKKEIESKIQEKK